MEFSDVSSELLFSNLGENLVVEILARLPCRTAIRLKLVCKTWCSLISSQYFITLFNHRRHDPSLPPILHSSSACIIFQSQIDPFSPIVCGGYPHPDANLCGFRKLDLSFLPCPDPQLRIYLKVSCADLILCAPICVLTTFPKFLSLFYVCNLVTKHWTALPPPPQFKLSERKMPRAMSFGLLCVPAPCSLCTTPQQSQCVDNSRYNCVVVQICVSPPVSRGKYRLQLFSSQEWKTLVISSPWPIKSLFLLRSSVFLVPYKGMLHMLLSAYILVYDPYNSPEKISRAIYMPTDMEAEGCCAQTLGVFEDRLRLTCTSALHSEIPIYYIWELENYDMGKWSLVRKVYFRGDMFLSNLDLLHPNLDPKIKDTGFNHIDGSYFYWTNSSGWFIGNGIINSITHQWWPTPVPPLIRGCTIQKRYIN
ncbi:PREDICTED: F-box protein At5g49610-like isoform X2 [Ipomoea nil]|uniref:F-box protein At5g49610-like isoform X2 n=1 Tax=Ipomoea nil TaxID=35883 RepID=UPI0009017C9A|nr:PREDICTED: F-box protein At5g49610-like isoform X2 [Ipomoea nil]